MPCWVSEVIYLCHVKVSEVICHAEYLRSYIYVMLSIWGHMSCWVSEVICHVEYLRSYIYVMALSIWDHVMLSIWGHNNFLCMSCWVSDSDVIYLYGSEHMRSYMSCWVLSGHIDKSRWASGIIYLHYAEYFKHIIYRSSWIVLYPILLYMQPCPQKSVLQIGPISTRTISIRLQTSRTFFYAFILPVRDLWTTRFLRLAFIFYDKKSKRILHLHSYDF